MTMTADRRDWWVSPGSMVCIAENKCRVAMWLRSGCPGEEVREPCSQKDAPGCSGEGTPIPFGVQGRTVQCLRPVLLPPPP